MPELDKDTDQEVVVDELQTLKDKADLLGVTYHPSVGVAKLREKINAKLNDQPDPEKEVVAPVAVQPAYVVKEETPAQKRVRLRDEQRALVRVNITCMNPSKAQWDGEIFTVGNNAVGTVRRFVPFNTPDGWHVERILLTMLQQRECRIFQTKKENGKTLKVPKMIREFAIEILDPLTEKELKELERRQAMQAGQD